MPAATDQERRTPARHSYSVGTIGLFLQMVLGAATSLRAATGVLQLLCGRLPFLEQAPRVNAGRSWLLRIGLAPLTCEKQQADDWVWIMDHTLQLGPYQCLVIVGIRLSAWDAKRPLRHEDMTLLNLTPMERSRGECVQEQLEATVQATGVPRAVVSDEGTDLKRGMEFFRKTHSDIRHQHDLKHKNALLRKKELTADDRWSTFVKEANRTKLGTTQTSLAFLNPPGLKTKARSMNLDTLVSWGERTLNDLDAESPAADDSCDERKVEEKLAWLRGYRADLHRWSELLPGVRTAEKAVHGGIRVSLCEELRADMAPLTTTPAAQALSEEILGFLKDQSAGLTADDRLIGSSEVLESIIGKYKRLQSSHSKGGMTAMLLSIGALVGRQTNSMITSSLERIREADVGNWCQTHLGITLQSQKRLAFSATKPG